MKENTEITRIRDTDQLAIAHASRMMIMSYGIWAHSLENPETAIESRTLINGKIVKFDYLSKEELTKKVDSILNEEKPEPLKYLIDSPTQRIEEISLPDFSDLGPYKIEHFYGWTGHGQEYPRLNSSVNEKALSEAAESYMGSVLLFEDEKKPEDQKLYIVFRGSRGGNTQLGSIIAATRGKGTPDWVTDTDLGPHLSIKKSLGSTLHFNVFSGKRFEIYMHSGISKAYYSCRQGIIQCLRNLKINNLNNFKGQVIVTGHSLGGGLATVCAADLRGIFAIGDNRTFSFQFSNKELSIDDPAKLTCISFSAPAVGNDLFAKKYAELVPQNLRVLIDSDPITAEFKSTLNINHVHGKVDLAELSEELPEGTLPKHLQFGSLLDAKAHEPNRVMELANLLADQKHIVPTMRTVSKTDLLLHASFSDELIKMINCVSNNKDSKDLESPKNKLLASYGELLNNLLDLNTEAVKFSSLSRFHGDGNIKEYIKLLDKIIAASDKMLKIPVDKGLSRDLLAASIRRGVAYMRSVTKDQKELLSDKAPALTRLHLSRIFVSPSDKPSTSGSSEISQGMSSQG